MNSHPKKTIWISLFLFFIFLFANFFWMRSPSAGSLETGASISSLAFDPGTMLLLGSALIGLAALGRKKFEK